MFFYIVYIKKVYLGFLHPSCGWFYVVWLFQNRPFHSYSVVYETCCKQMAKYTLAAFLCVVYSCGF